MSTNVLLIRAFEGPRHERLERIWVEVAKRCPINLKVLDNRGMALRHAQCLARMWEEEVWRPEPVCVFTEFDFLPYDRFWEREERADVLATMYCTRAPDTMRLSVEPRMAGAWFVLVNKSATLLSRRHDILRGLSEEAGKYRDPCNALQADRLIEVVDAYPDHYGVSVVGRGVHLFFSRHYHDPAHLQVAGFSVRGIQRGVDKMLDRYERFLEQCPGLPRSL